MTGRKRVVKGREVSGLVSSCSVTCDLGLSEWRGRRVDVEGEGAVRRIEVRVRTTGSGVSGATSLWSVPVRGVRTVTSLLEYLVKVPFQG